MMTLAAWLRGSQEISISGTTSLVSGGPYVNVIVTTVANVKVRLPDARSLRLGRAQRWIANNGSNAFTVRDGASNDLVVLNPGDCADFHLAGQANAAGLWKWELRTLNSAASPGLSLLAYIIGGQTNSGSTHNKDTLEWNPQTSTWTSKTASPLSTGWQRATSFVIGAHGYIANPTNSSTSVERYDPDVHTAMTSLPGTISSLALSCSCTLAGLAYVQSNGLHVYEYNEGSNSWATRADRASGQSVAAGGFLPLQDPVGYCFAGIVSFVHNRTDAYTQATDTWVQKTTRIGPNTLRFGNAMLNGLGFTFGGDNGTSTTIIRDTNEYNPGSDAWIKRVDFPGAAKTNSNAVPLLNIAYVMGGTHEDTFYTPENYAYDPIALTWTSVLSIPHELSEFQNHGMPIAV